MPSPLTVFGALNLNARNFDVELRRAQEKLQNGMSGFLTQPVLSAQAVVNLKRPAKHWAKRRKILAGIMPVVSQRNAVFMENEVNGIHVDAEIIERFAGLDRAQGEELGLKVSVRPRRLFSLPLMTVPVPVQGASSRMRSKRKNSSSSRASMRMTGTFFGTLAVEVGLKLFGAG